MCRNNISFTWMLIQQTYFEHIKWLAVSTPILQPIDPKNKDPIWVICDASVSGVGCMYGQGPTWQTCKPAGFMSKKFTPAQYNYHVFKLETLAILEALLKWENKLLGYRIHVVTDHKALEFFLTQQKLSNWQAQWMEYLLRFNFDIHYIKRITNKVVDALLRYYESNTSEDVHRLHEYVNADIQIDKEQDDLPIGHWEELVNDQLMALRHSMRLQNKCHEIKEPVEAQDREATELQTYAKVEEPSVPMSNEDKEDITIFHSRPQGENPMS